MNECIPSLLSSGNSSIAWIAENIRHSWLDPLIVGISYLGKVEPCIFITAFIYWFWNKHAGRHLGYALFTTLLVNMVAKNIIMECRPPSQFWMETIASHSYSFPSGHAQGAIVLWGGIAYFVGSKLLARFYLLIGLLIAFSRSYMGVHYLHDVLAGLIIGGIILAISLYCYHRQLKWLTNNLWMQASILLAVLFSIALFSINIFAPYSHEYIILATAGSFSFWLGCQWEERWLKFAPLYQPLALFIQFLISIGGTLLLREGFNYWPSLTVFSPPQVQALQYFLLGLWVSFIAPLLFVKFNLAKTTNI